MKRFNPQHYNDCTIRTSTALNMFLVLFNPSLLLPYPPG